MGSQLHVEVIHGEAGVGVFLLSKKGFCLSLFLASVTIVPTPAPADMNEVTSLLLKVCLAGGTSSQAEGQAKGDVALTLNALKTGRIGADASLGGKYSKTDWEGLQGGISAGMTALQADQADKARACLAPYMPGIVQAILQSVQPPSQSAPVTAKRIIRTHLVCRGYFETGCPAHDEFVGCDKSLSDWAQQKCGTYTVKTMSRWDGGLCSYQLAEVSCTAN